jgi:glycosyltransferase involved in cell wall biosynthesis
MRILHLDAGREMRGGQWQVLRLIEGLCAAGVESTLLARNASPLFVAARKQGWRVQPLGIARILASLRTHDLIHAHDSRSHTLATLAPSRPLVVARRVAFPFNSPWKYGRARRYLAVSEFVKQVLIAGAVPAEKIAVVYDGVPVLEVAHGDEILGLEKDSVLLASMGIKPVTDLEAQLPQAKMLVYISQSEGLGSGALLAMSSALPVIASNIGGLPEIVRHGETGLLVPNDREAIAAAIRQLSEDPHLCRRMGAAARHTVLERFTVAQMVDRTLESYRKVLNS